MTRPNLLIERWLPTTELGIESIRERAVAMDLPPLFALHVWWARRPLVASAAAVLGSLLPAWTPELAEAFSEHPEVASDAAYRRWFVHLTGIHGDPVGADRLKQKARADGRRLAQNPFTYKNAHKNNPAPADLRLLHQILAITWGGSPHVLDPTAGGGSIPMQAIRFGIDVTCNDLNPIAVAVMRASIGIPREFGRSLIPDLIVWGDLLCTRLEEKLRGYFPAADGETVTNYLFARTVACPRTGKIVPLAPNWWLDSKGGVAVELVTSDGGTDLDQLRFEIVSGKQAKAAAKKATVSGGKGRSPWDDLIIDGDYIKAEAQAGRMGSMLYAVAIRGSHGKAFRPPTKADLEAIVAAELRLDAVLPEWEVGDVIPNEPFPFGNDMRPVTYGMPRWRDMFSPRQLLVQGTFVEEFRKLIPEVRAAMEDQTRADAVLALLALVEGKTLNYNSILSSWIAGRWVTRSVFDRHDFSFKWTFAEMEGASDIFRWAFERGVLRAYKGLIKVLDPEVAPLDVSDGQDISLGAMKTSLGNAGDLRGIADEACHAICIDPPYHNNVMYAELSDFFYVWEKRTLGLVWPDLFEADATNKDDEAVANEARFEHAGRRKSSLASLDYERKMTSIFAECHRVLVPSGVMTVMFTHKTAEAWDILGQSLLEAGFTIEASWPVQTESVNSLHQARQNSAQSTIMLVCRKRSGTQERTVFFESIEGDVRLATRNAYSRFIDAGMSGVDLLLSTYGPALSVLSEHWPVYSSEPDETGNALLLRPEEALDAAREEVMRLQLSRLVASSVEFDVWTDFWLLAWYTFGAREFPFDEVRKLALATGGLEVDDLQKAKLLKKKTGTVIIEQPGARVRREADFDSLGVHRDKVVFPALVDALHTALYILDNDGAMAARNWLAERRLTADGRFQALVQAAVNAVPRVKQKGEFLVPEARLLEGLVRAAFPDTQLPVEEYTLEGQTNLDL